MNSDEDMTLVNEVKSIMVAVRVRPLSDKELDLGIQSCCSAFKESSLVTINKTGDSSSCLKSQTQQSSDYIFDAVFDTSATQMEVYEKTTQPFINQLIAGFNVTVFAYGATSAGKTHTMFGNTRAGEAAMNTEAGIIPNAIQDIFRNLRIKESNFDYGERWEIKLSYVEVYNEKIYDLLVSGKGRRK